MYEKSSLFTALLCALTSVVSAATEDDLHTLAICFLILCIIILIIVIVVPLALYRRQIRNEKNGYTGSGRASRYNLSAKERKISEANGKDPIGFYGIYNDPQPAGSIYLPLDKINQGNDNYAHLKGSREAGGDPHTYEELKGNKGTFGPTYDNPGATVDEDEDDHDYESADPTIVRPNRADYENPPNNTNTTM